MQKQLRVLYEGMKQREEKMPLAGKPRLKEAAQRLVDLFERTSRPDQAAQWKRKHEDFDQTQTNRKAPSSLPKP